jgi:hypothetical protein
VPQYFSGVYKKFILFSVRNLELEFFPGRVTFVCELIMHYASWVIEVTYLLT